MTQQTLTIGACPAEEEPAQLGISPDFARLNRLEVACYQAALIACYGPPPPSVEFKREASDHDFGRYVELAIRFDDQDETATDYAFRVEDGIGRWFHAGFTAPVDYPTAATPVINHADVDAAIRSAISIMRPPYPEGARMIANLRAHYPAHAT